MAIGTMLTSPDIEGRLGADGVAEAAASLWPEDCQTCGRPLGPRPPALCVDDLGSFAMATPLTTWPASSATRGCCAAGSPARAAADGRTEKDALPLA